MLAQHCGTDILVPITDTRLPGRQCSASQVVGFIAPVSYRRVFPNKLRRLYREAEPKSLPLTLLA